MIKKLRIGLPLKFIISISIVIILTSLSLTWFFINNQVIQIRTALEDRCALLAQNLALDSEFGVLTGNKTYLKKLNEQVIKEDDVFYSVIYNKDGNILTLSEIAKFRNLYKEIEPLLTYKMHAAVKKGTSFDNKYIKDIIKITYNSKDAGPVHDTICPIMIDRIPPGDAGHALSAGAKDINERPELVGFARVGISISRMYKQIADIRKGVMVLTSIVVVFGIILSIFLVRIIVQPIKQLSIGTRKLASGDLNYHVNVKSNDEIGELADSFNLMASDIRKHVREQNKEKEDLFVLKTALEQRTRELEETILKVKNIQQELLRSEKFATIGRLASSIAHELRNPLASLKNISYYLIKLGAFNADDKAKQMLDMLSIDVARANRIVTDLLDFSRIKKINRTPTKIDDLINDFLDNLDFGQNISITRKLEKITANIDPDKLKQVLLNIFSNARDAMPEGGSITISAFKKDLSAVITVSDTGNGMDEETMNHIFDPLFSTKTKGLGLSLAIVKEVMELHSGRITVVSKKGEGTTFELLLPLD